MADMIIACIISQCTQYTHRAQCCPACLPCSSRTHTLNSTGSAVASSTVAGRSLKIRDPSRRCDLARTDLLEGAQNTTTRSCNQQGDGRGDVMQRWFPCAVYLQGILLQQGQRGCVATSEGSSERTALQPSNQKPIQKSKTRHSNGWHPHAKHQLKK